MPRLVALGGITLAVLAAGAGALRADRGRRLEHAAERVEADARTRDRDIEFYRERASRDSASARDRMQLGALYLQRARASGSDDDVRAAETWARASLALRAAHNGAAHVVLASSLSAQHRFGEALDVARELRRLDPSRPSYQALHAEIALELGRYPEADSLFAELGSNGDALSLGPRLARWEELHGHPEQARRWLSTALAAAERRAETPPEQLAWLHLRLGELALRNGAAGAAAGQFRGGLSIVPGDHRLLAAYSRLEYSRRNWARAIELGERALGLVLDPATLGLLADASTAAGDTVSAARYARSMGVAIGSRPGAMHRAWSLYQLDHGGDPAVLLGRAREELRHRQDVYGYDLLAWALHRAGQPASAWQAIQPALALGTRDPLLHFHAGMIARAAGRDAQAATSLRRALAINPSFDPLLADSAQATLDSIGGR